MSVEIYGWAIQKTLFAQINQDSTFYYTCNNSKMFNVTSKYFRFLQKTTCKLSRAYNKEFSDMLFLFAVQFHANIDPLYQINYLPNSTNYLIQKNNNNKKSFGLDSRLLGRDSINQEAIWLTVINEMFKSPP